MTSPQGKQIGSYTYWHESLTNVQPFAWQQAALQAAELAGVSAGRDFNVIKLADDGDSISLLYYPAFFDDPFPALATSWTIVLSSASVKRRSYAESLNPPILHRKELFIAADHPRQQEYTALTQQAEQLGLFENTRTIGFRLAWQALIESRGYYLVEHQLLPLGNNDTNENLTDIVLEGDDRQMVQRHRTAMTRYNLSAPMQALARFGFLDGSYTVFDYGCGKGDDIRNLQANNISVAGWDPYYAPNEIKQCAALVNLGFVINVIEDLDERIAALQGAYQLTETLLVVSAMLYNQNAFKGQQYQDGVLTSRHTFQKYYQQGELKAFIEEVTGTDALAVGPGIFFVFRDHEAEQRFLLGRQRSRANLLRLTQRERQPRTERQARPERQSIRDQQYQHKLSLIKPLRACWLSLGRPPLPQEITDVIAVLDTFRTLGQALRFVEQETEPELLERARLNRIDDLLVYFALHAFSQRKPYQSLDAGLQRDIKVFFGNYQQALAEGRALLFKLGQTDLIESSCQHAAEMGIGHYDEEHALYVPSEQVERLPALLRVYIGCAAMVYGDIGSADLIKIHINSGKLSFMRYDDFSAPLPRLLERVKIKFRSLDFEYYQYGEVYEPPYLYFKSRYLNEDNHDYVEQLAFDEQVLALKLIDANGYGLSAKAFDTLLAQKRWAVQGMELVRSQSIPDLDMPCGEYLHYRDLIECGETWQHLHSHNLPQQADTYTALYELAVSILDPVIDYFGMLRLTYGFCSAELAKHIPARIAPKLDQHASYERNRLGNVICPRLGAAVDFIIEDEDMLEVAKWIAEHTPFDRLYFYGVDKPIHVSFGPEQKGEWVDMVQGVKGRLIPKVRRL